MQPESTGYGGTVQGLELFDPVRYYNLWDGDLSIPGVQGSNRKVTSDEWAALVNKARSQGVKSLAGDDRVTLFQGGLKAYLMSVHATQRLVIAAGAKAKITEVYGMVGGEYALPIAREQQSTNAKSSWPDGLEAGPATYVARAFVDSQDGNTLRSWTQADDGTWACRVDKGVGADIALNWSAAALPALIIVLGDNSVKEATYSGRKAMLFRSDSNTGEWMDESTLLPLGFFLPGDATGELAREVQITALNASVTIDPPGTC